MAFVSQASPLTPARRRAQELAASGDLVGARAILEKAVELGKANLSEDDPDVLLTAYHLGQVYQRLDDQSAARRVLEEAYAAGQWRLGDHDPLMVEISYDIGVVAEELGNRHEARKAFTRVAEFGPAALGAGHEAVVRAQAYLGHASDSVRSSAPPPGPASPIEPHLTLVTPVPSEHPFGRASTSEGEERTAAVPPVRPASALVQPPPPVEPIWTPAPSPRRSPEGVDEPTIVHPTIKPRPTSRQSFQQMSQAFGQGGQRLPTQRPVDQQWAPPPPHHHLIGAASPAAGTPHPAGAASGGDAAYRKRGLGLFAAIAAVMASLIAVAALVFVLANRRNDSPPASDVPTLAGRAPTDVKLTDRGSEIEIRWTDPSPGQVSFIVVMAHPGEEFKAMTTLGPGTTSYRAGGLNAKLNYCFAVAAVYSAKTYATSNQSCTSRATVDPGPSTGK
jgi:hypothetical protein